MHFIFQNISDFFFLTKTLIEWFAELKPELFNAPPPTLKNEKFQ